MNRARTSGFTLLEAIVALVIFSIGAVALYAWLATNIRTLDRVQASRDRAAVVTAALDMVRRVNPMQDATGGRDAGNLRIEWTSRAVEPPRRGVSQVGIPTRFMVGLYALHVRVLREGREVDAFDVRQVGYHDAGGAEDDEL